MADWQQNSSASVIVDRVVIDTAKPFESVKDAVSLFGGKTDDKRLKFLERSTCSAMELCRLQDEAEKLKELLKRTEQGKAEALSDLAEAKRNLEGMRLRLDQLTKGVNGKADEIEGGESVFKLVEAFGDDVEKLKKELSNALREKECMRRQAEEAMAALEVANKRVEELSSDLSGANESLSLVKLAYMEADKERASLSAATRSVLTSSERPSMEIDMEMGSSVYKLEETRLSLARTVSEGRSLRVVLESLDSELEVATEEIRALRERELNTSSAATALTEELRKTFKTGSKTNDSVVLGLSHALQEVSITKSEIEYPTKSSNLAYSCNDIDGLRAASKMTKIGGLQQRENRRFCKEGESSSASVLYHINGGLDSERWKSPYNTPLATFLDLDVPPSKRDESKTKKRKPLMSLVSYLKKKKDPTKR